MLFFRQIVWWFQKNVVRLRSEFPVVPDASQTIGCRFYSTLPIFQGHFSKLHAKLLLFSELRKERKQKYLCGVYFCMDFACVFGFFIVPLHSRSRYG